jgi:translocation and assembly module TamB
LRGSLPALGACVAVIAFAELVLLHGLDQPWMKRRLQGLVCTSAGVEIDYRTARIDLFRGAQIEGLVVRSPPEVRPFAPDFVRVGRLDARWSLRSLLSGRALIGRIALSDVKLTVVVDEQGRTSLDALFPPAPGPKVPLSRKAALWFGNAPLVDQVDVDRLTLVWVRTARREVFDRTELRGLAVAGRAESTAKGWRLAAGLGSSTDPLDLQLTREQRGAAAAAARASLWVTVDASSLAITAVLDLRLIEQTFAPRISADHGLHVEGSVQFDPAAGRTEIGLDHTEAGDGAATARAVIDVSDAGAAIVRSASGDIDFARLLRWLPPGLVPVTTDRARIRYQIDSLVVGPDAHLSEGGAVVVDADLSNVAVNAPFKSVEIGSGELSLHAHGAPSVGVAFRGSAHLVGMRLGSGHDRLAADDLALDLDGLEGPDGRVAGRVAVRLARVERGDSAFVARDGHVELRVDGLRPDTDEPLATRGDLSLSSELGSLDVRFAGRRATVDGLTFRAHTILDGHAPYTAELETAVSRLRVVGRDGALLVDSPVHIEAGVRDVQPDAIRPTTSRGAVHVAADLSETHATLDMTKGTGTADFALRATARSLKSVRPFLPPIWTDAIPWDRISVALRSSGRVQRLGTASPTVTQTTDVDVDSPGFFNVGARSLSLTLRSEGTALQHRVHADLRARGVAIDGGSAVDDHMTLSASLNRERPSLQFQLATEGQAETHLSGSLAFDPSRRGVSYEIEAQLAALAPLAPFAANVRGLGGLDLSQLGIGLSARGEVLGVVAAVGRDGTIVPEPSPARTAAVEGKTDLRVTHMRWAQGSTAVLAPVIAWHGDMTTVGARRTLDSRTEISTVHLDLGSRNVDVNGISDKASVTVIGNLADPAIDLSQRISVRAVAQGIIPGYPMGDLAFALSAERGPEGVVHVSDLTFVNALAGTTFTLRGNVDLGDERRTLSVATSLTQSLASLSTVPEHFKGRGTVAVEASVTSPDLAHYEVRAALKGKDVSVTLPQAGFEAETANGEVPITVSLEVRNKGVALRRSERGNPYSMLRFADQHPLLSRSGFLSIARLKTPWLSIAPLVGNLEIEQNVVSLRQFEMGVRGGTITGQCGMVWNGRKSTLEFHVRANGVQSSHGEPFDGNVAVVVSAADRTIDGRAEILRIGAHHLLDLLDLEDPLHADPAMNRVRAALAFGYPDSLRLVFDHGFASAHLQLGGLARLISIGELRGIPTGPLVDKMLAPLLDGPDMVEGP